MLALLIAARAAHACDAPVSAEALTEHAVAAHAAFAGLDDPGFDAAIDALSAAAPCAREPLSPEQAARILAARALAAFVGDGAETVPTLQAALAAAPALTFSPWLPDNHVIYVELGIAQRLPADPTRALDPPAGETVRVNGLPADAIAVSTGDAPQALQPALVQLERSGAVAESALLDVGAPLPAWVALADEPMSPAVKRRLALGSATAATALTSGALVALTAYQRDRFLSSDTDYESLQALDRKNTAAFAGAVGAAAASAGLGAALVLTW